MEATKQNTGTSKKIARKDYMNEEQKGKFISKIMETLKSQAIVLGKRFDEGIFFDLIFMSDAELLRVKSLCGL